ncbi:MAG TPA: diacylglycerol kinase family protein [Tepidisphaeraceae bacterium]|jgi:diacylglycerol kinase family enzyme
MRVAVITNPHAGPTAHPTPAEIRDALAKHGVTCELCSGKGKSLSAAIEEAVRNRPDAVIASGGDGTVSSVAAALVNTGIPLGVLATGTLNHFAKDMGLPLELEPAAAVIAAGHVRAVDVGQVNGQTFINNASIGIYPRIVTKRDEIRERLGRGKFVAMLMAVMSLFRRYTTVHVRINSPEVAFARNTPFLFVGNNRYEMSLNAMGKRTALDRGELSVYFTTRTGRFGLFMLALRGLFGKLEQERDFTALNVAELHIDTPRRHVPIALDGEVRRMSPPLEFRTLPGALKVLALTPAENGVGA